MCVSVLFGNAVRLKSFFATTCEDTDEKFIVVYRCKIRTCVTLQPARSVTTHTVHVRVCVRACACARVRQT